MQQITDNIQAVLTSLKKNRFNAIYAADRDEARKIMMELISPSASVGVGDSVTLKQIGIFKDLQQRGNEVVNPFTKEFIRNMRADKDVRALFLGKTWKAMNCDVFITGSNAVTANGKLVSIDYAGNRVAGIIYGAPKVIIAVGRNKIVNDVESAISRIRNVLAPIHAKRKGILTPCARTGKCSDCSSPNRICNITAIIEKKPGHTDFTVIIINEDLGLGWDPSWEQERIDGIRSAYYRETPVFK